VLEAVAIGLLFGLSAGFSPGPLLTLVVAQTLEHGVREGVKVAVTPILTDLPILAAAGLAAAWVARLEPVLGWVSLAGAAVVAYLGVSSLRTRPLAVEAGAGPPRSLARGMVVNALSPHPYLFWATVGVPTMARTAAAAGVWAAAAFAATFLVALSGAKVLLAVLVGRFRDRVTGRAYVWTMRVLGALLLVFAAVLATDGATRLTGRGPAGAGGLE
jgi:threonine/homoserine/homoserine lactone efflux protein